MFISLYSEKECPKWNSTSLTPFTFFNTQTHPSGNAAATTAATTWQKQVLQDSMLPLPPLTLRLNFCFQALETDFPEDLKNPQQHRSDSVYKTRQLFHTHDYFFEQWAACLCSSNLPPIWGKNWQAHIPFQIIATASQCRAVCAEKIKQNTVISAIHIMARKLPIKNIRRYL